MRLTHSRAQTKPESKQAEANYMWDPPTLQYATARRIRRADGIRGTAGHAGQWRCAACRAPAASWLAQWQGRGPQGRLSPLSADPFRLTPNLVPDCQPARSWHGWEKGAAQDTVSWSALVPVSQAFVDSLSPEGSRPATPTGCAGTSDGAWACPRSTRTAWSCVCRQSFSPGPDLRSAWGPLKPRSHHQQKPLRQLQQRNQRTSPSQPRSCSTILRFDGSAFHAAAQSQLGDQSGAAPLLKNWIGSWQTSPNFMQTTYFIEQLAKVMLICSLQVGKCELGVWTGADGIETSTGAGKTVRPTRCIATNLMMNPPV